MTDGTAPRQSDEPETDITVLFVDDEPELLNLYVGMCGSEYSVITANSGEEALDKFGNHIDFAFVDMRMPDLTGTELVRALRQRGFQTPIAFVSAVDPRGDLAVECRAYLRKPVRKEEVLTTVEESLS